jgi:uncharacterized membrane protein YccC
MPAADELLFALKTFAGAIAALYVSFRLGLENPYWAMASAFIVANPFAGAMRSKALYRFMGTLLGGTAAVALVPNLVDAPVLLSLALALWIGFCLYVSLLDRSPRAYTFLLAGYTAGIIGFPSVTAPGLVFETALTRGEEICIGIACTTIVGTLVFPRPLGPVLARRIGAWTRPAVDWASAALAGEGESPAAREARRRLAFEATDVAMMITQLAYDVSHLQSAVRHVTRLRIYTISLMPVLSSIADRVAYLKQIGGITPPLATVLAETSAWIRNAGPVDDDALLARILRLEEDAHDWPALLRASLARRLEELVSIVRHARALRRHVVDGQPAPGNKVLDAEYVAITAQNRDHKLALLSALAAALAVLAVCAVWIGTAWSAGAGAAIMVAVACSFFAAQDDPAPAIAGMLRSTAIAVAGVGVYDFGVIPRIDSFTGLVLALLPAGVIIGVLIARPATFGMGMNLGAVGATTLALENGSAPDFPAYANNAVATLAGIGSALVITRLIRSFGAAWSAERLLRANWRDVAAAAEAGHDRARLTGIMMDRLGLMMPRLAAVASGADAAASLVLRDLRVGLNIIALHREQGRLPPSGRVASDAVFGIVAAHYRADPRQPPPLQLAEALDTAMIRLIGTPQAYRTALMILSGLRSVLFPGLPPPAFPVPVAA